MYEFNYNVPLLGDPMISPAATMEQRMASADPGKRAVKIDEQIVSRAKVVAARRKVNMADYLSELLRPLVNRDYTKAIKEMAREESSESE
jgi:hypothetical protein